MALETASYISQLNPANPSGADRIQQGDDHIRLLKGVLKATFPNITGPVTASQDLLNKDFTLPTGLITAWYGDAASVPAGWAICNGQKVQRTDGSGEITLPDLRDRVLIGAGGAYAPLATPGAASQTVTTNEAGGHTHTVGGGAHTHTGEVQDHALTEAQLPAHKHTNGVGDNAPGVFNRGTVNASPGSSSNFETNAGLGNLEGYTSTVGSGQAHKHGLTINEATHTHTVSEAASHTHTAQVSTLQPSLALHFIMKV